MKLFRGLFKHYTLEELLGSEVKEDKRECKLCKAVKTAGRSGVKTAKFINGDTVKLEIVNMSNVPDRMCYTLEIFAGKDAGWVELPIRYCPACGHSLRSTRKC